MKGLVPRITQLQGSGIREIMTLALQKPSVIRLEVGEPDFDTPDHIVEAASRALREGQTKYISNAGLPPLRRAVAHFFESSTGVPTSPDRILVTHGAILSLATTWELCNKFLLILIFCRFQTLLRIRMRISNESHFFCFRKCL